MKLKTKRFAVVRQKVVNTKLHILLWIVFLQHNKCWQTEVMRKFKRLNRTEIMF